MSDANAPFRLDPYYRFANFVAGPENLEALGAARHIGAGCPIVSGAPIVIWGESGLGKTHLLHAIGNAIVERDSTAQVRPICGPRWRMMEEFRENLRKDRVILIESVHFLGLATTCGDRTTKPDKRLLRDFQNTINSLVEGQRQVVLEADRSPEELRKIGLHLAPSAVDIEIEPPNLAMRIALLKLKAERRQIDLPDSVVRMIAELVVSNARELEGVLHRLSSLEGRVTLSRARARLRDVLAAHAAWSSRAAR